MDINIIKIQGSMVKMELTISQPQSVLRVA